MMDFLLGFAFVAMILFPSVVSSVHLARARARSHRKGAYGWR